MERIAKMDYELDPNSPFNKLKKLQVCLKQETSLLDIFFDEKEQLLKKVNDDCYEYYKANIEIMEIYDDLENNYITINEENEIKRKYEMIKNTHSELSQCYEIVIKFLFGIRNNYNLIMKVIEKIDITEYDDFANFFCNYFFNNILSSDVYEESLYVLILFLFEKEIRELKNTTSLFLNLNKSFTAHLLKFFLRKIDVKIFFETILKEVKEKIVEVNKDYSYFFGFDLNKIKNFLLSTKMNKLKKQIKTIEPKILLLKDITKSKLFDYNKEILNKEKEEKENEDINKIFYFDVYQNKIKQKTKNKQEIREIEQYLINSGIYTFNNYIKKEFNIDEININYLELSLDKEMLIGNAKNAKKVETQQFFFKQLIFIESDNNIFTTNKLLDEIIKLKEKPDMNYRIILLYKYQFEKIKNLIDIILIAIINNIHLIPYNIKCICLMIDKIIQKKFTVITLIERNAFIGYFFFHILLCTVLLNPKFNGILINIGNVEEIESAVLILKKISRSLWFNSNKENEFYYTIFNNYILEIQPFILKIFDYLRNDSLPNSIEKLIDKIDFLKPNTNINYDFMEFRPEERVNFQSICFSWDILILMYKIIKDNEKEFDNEDNKIFYKSFKKLVFQEKTMNKKFDNDIKNNRKSFIYITEPIFDKNLDEVMKRKKNKKFSFQTNESLNQLSSEKFILLRVKYCINILVKNLNPITRENYFIEKGENEEDFAIALNKILELEGFSDILKEQTIPLRWFGLYLQSNISNIPIEYKRQKYLLLLNELIEDTEKNISNLTKDESLNFLYLKNSKSEKLISLCQKYLNELKDKEIIFIVNDIINKTPEKVFIIEIVNKKEIVKYDLKTELTNDLKPFKKYICENVNQYILNFPNIIELRDIENIFEHEKKLHIPNLIKDYFSIILQHLSSKNIYKEEKQKRDIIIKDITNYIFHGIYNKLYNPDQPSPEDLKIYQNCFMYDWVKPENIIENYTSINEEMILVGINYILKINNEKSPIEKLECLLKIDEIISNIEYLYGYKDNENNRNHILLYLCVKAHPNFFNSDCEFIHLYIPNYYNHGRSNKILSDMKNVVYKLLNLSYSDIFRMTEEEYNNKMNL